MYDFNKSGSLGELKKHIGTDDKRYTTNMKYVVMSKYGIPILSSPHIFIEICFVVIISSTFLVKLCNRFNHVLQDCLIGSRGGGGWQ